MSTIPTHTERHPLLQLAADMPAMPGAACVGLGELFFATEHQQSPTYAKNICLNQCPELDTCRGWVLANPSLAPFGVWAGMTETERNKIRRRNQPAERRRRKRK